MISGSVNFSIYRGSTNICSNCFTTASNYVTVSGSYIDKSVAEGAYTYYLYIDTNTQTGNIALGGLVINAVIL